MCFMSHRACLPAKAGAVEMLFVCPSTLVYPEPFDYAQDKLKSKGSG